MHNNEKNQRQRVCTTRGLSGTLGGSLGSLGSGSGAGGVVPRLRDVDFLISLDQGGSVALEAVSGLFSSS